VFGLIGSLGPWELVLIMAIVLIIFGPGAGRSICQEGDRGIIVFKSALRSRFQTSQEMKWSG
jgi:sec-independent protein translocase protein TatA